MTVKDSFKSLMPDGESLAFNLLDAAINNTSLLLYALDKDKDNSYKFMELHLKDQEILLSRL